MQFKFMDCTPSKRYSQRLTCYAQGGTLLIDNFIVDKFAFVCRSSRIMPSFVLWLKPFYGCCSPLTDGSRTVRAISQVTRATTCNLPAVSSVAPPGGDNMHGTYCHSAWHAARANGSGFSEVNDDSPCRAPSPLEMRKVFQLPRHIFICPSESLAVFFLFFFWLFMPEISVHPRGEGKGIAKAA